MSWSVRTKYGSVGPARYSIRSGIPGLTWVGSRGRKKKQEYQSEEMQPVQVGTGSIIFSAFVAIVILVLIRTSACSDTSTSGNNDNPDSSQKTISLTVKSGRIISVRGLNMRSDTDLQSNVITTIPYNEVVNIISASEQSETVSGRSGYWYLVEYNESRGWIFGGFVEINN